jgi:hypothetical protein
LLVDCFAEFTPAYEPGLAMTPCGKARQKSVTTS